MPIETIKRKANTKSLPEELSELLRLANRVNSVACARSLHSILAAHYAWNKESFYPNYGADLEAVLLFGADSDDESGEPRRRAGGLYHRPPRQATE